MTEQTKLLKTIADALERMAPPPAGIMDLDAAHTFVWQPENSSARPVPGARAIPLGLLRGIEQVSDILTDNTRRFARGYSANNALLWGARGMGKSSLVKAIHRLLLDEGLSLKLIEVHREDISTLPVLLRLLNAESHRVLLFCDDLSFDEGDHSYKSLKAVLDGGVEGRPENVMFYATSNRRHLMARNMIENEERLAIHGGEATQEKVSLSDRFGLWLGFHNCSQDQFLTMIDAYVAHFGLEIDAGDLRARAIEWQATRGARSGRVAWQFVTDLAGKLEKPLEY